MTEISSEKIRSFIIFLHDKADKIIGPFLLPLDTIAPFANRIIREVVPEKAQHAKEPWFAIIPHRKDQIDKLERDSLPEGPTSLYGVQYIPDSEPAPRVQLHPKNNIQFFTILIIDLNEEIYRGVFTVDDIFLAGAEYLARGLIEKGTIDPESGPFSYLVEISNNQVTHLSQDLFPPEAYQVEGVFLLPKLAEDRIRITFKRVKPSPLPEKDPFSFVKTQTRGRGKPGKYLIFMRSPVYKKLREEIFLHPKNEDGGYLLGIPYRVPGSPENEDDPEFNWMIEITDVIQAEGIWGNPVLLLFTGDSWSKIKRQIDLEFPNKKLVAWFHTHLFKATDEFGLSGLDESLHRRFLTLPWQVAVLLNIEKIGDRSDREIRCFQRGTDGELVECTYEIVESES